MNDIYFQLYKKENDEWVAQFRTMTDIYLYADMYKIDLNNDYLIRMEPTKYPSA